MLVLNQNFWSIVITDTMQFLFRSNLKGLTKYTISTLKCIIGTNKHWIHRQVKLVYSLQKNEPAGPNQLNLKMFFPLNIELKGHAAREGLLRFFFSKTPVPWFYSGNHNAALSMLVKYVNSNNGSRSVCSRWNHLKI